MVVCRTQPVDGVLKKKEISMQFITEDQMYLQEISMNPLYVQHMSTQELCYGAIHPSIPYLKRPAWNEKIPLRNLIRASVRDAYQTHGGAILPANHKTEEIDPSNMATVTKMGLHGLTLQMKGSQIPVLDSGKCYQENQPPGLVYRPHLHDRKTDRDTIKGRDPEPLTSHNNQEHNDDKDDRQGENKNPWTSWMPKSWPKYCWKARNDP